MLQTKVEYLVALRQEGAYWDFKREWYAENKMGDFLLDIICMANNLANEEAYIIIGIDEENDFVPRNVVGDPNRKNTQMVVDFMKDKKFAGGVRPVVYVKPISIEGTTVDVIVIPNSYNTPFYLQGDFKGVHANNIYTRVMDTNTPRDRTADISYVEYLWKKRFRLLEPPSERVLYYLQDKSNWIGVPHESTSKRYYKFFPEYTIDCSEESHKGYEYYVFNQNNKSTTWYKVNIYYHQTLINSLGGVSLDSGRYFSSVPETAGITTGAVQEWDVTYKYFVKDTIEYLLHLFYADKESEEAEISRRRFEECVLIFESEDEKKEFEAYVLIRWQDRDRYRQRINLPLFPQIEDYVMEEFAKDYENVQILQWLLKEFRCL